MRNDAKRRTQSGPFGILHIPNAGLRSPSRAWLFQFAFIPSMKSRGFLLSSAKWSDDIHDEWIGNLLAARPDLKKSRLKRTMRLMDNAIPDACISRSQYEKILPSLSLPDPKDCHVFAAAIFCQAQFIVTFNLKDFPKNILEKYKMEAIHPDNFVSHLLDLSTDTVLDCVNLQQSMLKNPPLTMQNLLMVLRKNGLTNSMNKIEAVLNL